MSRPVGSKNKSKERIPFNVQAENRDKVLYPHINTPVKIPPVNFVENTANLQKAVNAFYEPVERRAEVRYDAKFGIRVLRDGQFRGLWELVSWDDKGNKKVITDANSRGMVINMINRHIMKIIVMANAGS